MNHQIQIIFKTTFKCESVRGFAGEIVHPSERIQGGLRFL